MKLRQRIWVRGRVDIVEVEFDHHRKLDYKKINLWDSNIESNNH